MSDLDVYSSARAMADAVARKEISARELMELHLARIAETNPDVNAVVSLDEERARAGAAEADERQARGEELGPLHGLPHAYKDTHEVAGWRTTFGSPLRADHVPRRDELIVERIRRAGAVTIGKTNVPEWAAGSHTFNPVFGLTRNPYDLSRSAGGSSGGAAAALASGMVPLADGSDMGGSLRNPASFCNVVGLRPSVGRVPGWPAANGFDVTSVGGPMARSVEDLALLLSVVAGPSRRSPTSLETPGSAFAPPLRDTGLAGVRVALSVDLGGAITVDHAVADVVRAQAAVLEGAGAVVTDAHPVLHSADGAFRTLRAWVFHARFAALLEKRPDDFKESLRDNIRLGAVLTGADVARAYQQLSSIHDRMRAFFERYDVLAMPVSQVPPFSADVEYPADINGEQQATYLDWMRSAYLVTVTGCPAISVPAASRPRAGRSGCSSSGRSAARGGCWRSRTPSSSSPRSAGAGLTAVRWSPAALGGLVAPTPARQDRGGAGRPDPPRPEGDSVPDNELPAPITQALADADAALAALDAALAQLGDGDLHRAHRDGGWTVAQVVSHINMCALLWLGDMSRLAADPELRFFFREEVGHDLARLPAADDRARPAAARQHPAHAGDGGAPRERRRARAGGGDPRPGHDDCRGVDPADHRARVRPRPAGLRDHARPRVRARGGLMRAAVLTALETVELRSGPSPRPVPAGSWWRSSRRRCAAPTCTSTTAASTPRSPGCPATTSPGASRASARASTRRSSGRRSPSSRRCRAASAPTARPASWPTARGRSSSGCGPTAA